MVIQMVPGVTAMVATEAVILEDLEDTGEGDMAAVEGTECRAWEQICKK